MDTYKTINYKGYDINIEYDTCPMSPNEWENDDLFLVYDHRQFTVKRDGFDPETIAEHLVEEKTNEYDGYKVYPLYAYIHSGVALSLGRNSYPFECPWDTSMCGFVLVQKNVWKDEEAEDRAAQSLVDEWNQYLSGEVYGFVVDDAAGGDSCWGFYGDEGVEDAISQAKDSIDYYINKKIKEHTQQVKSWIKAHVPIEYRKPLTV